MWRTREPLKWQKLGYFNFLSLSHPGSSKNRFCQISHFFLVLWAPQGSLDLRRRRMEKRAAEGHYITRKPACFLASQRVYVFKAVGGHCYDCYGYGTSNLREPSFLYNESVGLVHNFKLECWDQQTAFVKALLCSTRSCNMSLVLENTSNTQIIHISHWPARIPNEKPKRIQNATAVYSRSLYSHIFIQSQQKYTLCWFNITMENHHIYWINKL